MENSSKSQKVASPPPQAHVCTRSLRRTLTHQRCRRWNPENDTLWWRRARALEPTGLSQTQPPPADECDLGQMRSLLEPCFIPASTPASLWGLSSRPPGPALHLGLRRASQNESEVEAKRTRRRRPGSVCALLRVFLPVWGVTEAVGAGEARGHLDPTEGTPVAPSCPFTAAQRARRLKELEAQRGPA